MEQAISIVQRPLDSGKVFVIDGLFGADIMRMMYELCRRLPFVRTEYATKADREHKLLNANLAPETLVDNPLLRRFCEAVVSQAQALLPDRICALDRVHCNAQAYGELQISHPDLGGGITGIYYANVHWEDIWAGETVFYGLSGEPELAVGMKPGRLVLFEADVVHRGGVPSVICPEVRYTVAFKFRPLEG